MYIRKYVWKKSCVIAVLLILMGTIWTVSLRASPGPAIEVSPGYEQSVNAGDTAIYGHVITNTGNVTAPIAIDSQIPDGWEISYITEDYPGGTTIWLPMPLAPDATLPVSISLVTPITATSGLYTSTITVTLLSSPTVEFPVYERTYINKRMIYLPLVMRNYMPFRNGSFEKGLAGWTIPGGVKLPTNVVNRAERDETLPVVGDNMVLLGDPKYACDDVPIGHAAVEQEFIVPSDAISMTFDYIIWTQDVSLDEHYDRFEVYIWRSNESFPDDPVYHNGNQETEGVSCANWWRIPEESGWETEEINLAEYQGQRVTVSFRVYNRQDNWYNTYAYLDNVQIITGD